MNDIEGLRNNNSIICKDVLNTYYVPVMKKSLVFTKINSIFSPRNS